MIHYYIISPDEINRNIQTVIIAPMTTKSYDYPTRIKISFKNKTGWIVLDQLRTVDKQKLVKRLGRISNDAVKKVKAVIKEMLVD